MSTLEEFRTEFEWEYPFGGWRDLGLYERYPHLYPDTELGRLAIDLELDLQQLAPQFKEANQNFTPQTVAISRDWRMADERWELFRSMYKEIEGSLENLNQVGGDSDYLDIVNTARQHQHAGNTGVEHLSTKETAELSKLIDRLSGLYRTENHHFDGLLRHLVA